MDAINYTKARANLAQTMDHVCNNHEAMIITRNGEQSVVMLSLEDYQSLQETAYLLRTPNNAKRLAAAALQLAEGNGVQHELVE
jgi:antitoxin YefM